MTPEQNTSKTEIVPLTDPPSRPSHSSPLPAPIQTDPHSSNPTVPRSAGQAFSFAIPDEDSPFFCQNVQADERKRIRVLLSVLEQIHSSIANYQSKLNPACRQHATSLEMSWRTLRQCYYNYTRYGCRKGACHYAAGDWRAIADWNKIKKEATRGRLPFAFLEFWRQLVENNQRKIKPAWDELIQILTTGFDFQNRPVKKIPGYDGFPEIDPVLGHPPGMSYANLLNHVSDPYDQSLARHGRIKGNELRLPVLKTRTSLLFGQYVEFDDHDFNQKVLFQKKPMRPSGFLAIEVLSSCPALMALKPNLWNFEEKQRLTLTEREFMWFVIGWLTTIGVRTDAVGTTLITERAKAVIKGQFKDRLLSIIPNLKIYAGSVPETNARAPHAGQWAGRGKGNFRTKALVESFFNPLDNQTASLAGQMGKDRDHSPAQLHGQEKYVRELTNRIEQMAPHALMTGGHSPSPGGEGRDEGELSLKHLQFPFLTFHQWKILARQAIDRIASARDHRCEGWEKLGFDRVLWRPSEDSANWFEPSELAALPELERNLIIARLGLSESSVRSGIFVAPGASPGFDGTGAIGADSEAAHGTTVPSAQMNCANPLLRTIRMSRQEVFNRNRRQLKPLPLLHVPELVGPENALNAGAPIHVRKGLFSFDCEEIDSDTLHFYACDQDTGNFLRNDSAYIAFVNPCCPSHLIACDEHLRVVAVCPRYELAHDDASLKHAMGEQARYESSARVRLDLRHDDAARRKKEMLENNDRILDADQRFLSGRAASPLGAAPNQPAQDSTQELLERESEETKNDDWS